MKTAALPFHVVATDGVGIRLSDGSELIDGIASWWTACHGYNPQTIVDAITQQAQQLPHVMMGGIVHDQALRLSRRLAAMTLGQDAKVFFSESGSVAVEVALKIAVQFWINNGQRDRKRFICFEGAYHGDTTGAMSVCDAQDSMHAHFKGYLIEHYPHTIPNTKQQQRAFEAFVAERAPTIAGVIIEPLIQMAAGMRMHTAESLNFIRETCHRHDVIVIADEVATGFGRTGTMFAFEQTDFKPDLLCLGKALTGGTTPLAATVAGDQIYKAFHDDVFEAALMHGPTFMGHAIGCAAANASLDLFEQQPAMERVGRINKSLKERLIPLSTLPGVDDVRVLGAVGAVEVDFKIDLGAALQFFRRQGVFIRPIGNVIYLAPSFTITDDQIRLLARGIQAFVESMASSSKALSASTTDSPGIPV
jgi:adenosylmethionine-8-amino-7-oxononanoate aminotransferase